MLLFLDSLADPFTARDGNGNARAPATLQFYAKGTTKEAPVYSDAALSTEISQPITADGAGAFETIYLDPAVAYRSLMFDADGELVFDVDYEIDDAFAGRNLMRSPIVHALDDDEVPIAGATLDFYVSGTTTRKDVYADPGLTTPLPNPLTADAGGFFPPIYLNGTYKVSPSWADAIDPYPPEPTNVDVTVQLLDGGVVGYWDGIDGSIDPDPFSLDGRQVDRMFQFIGSQWALHFADDDPTMPAGITQIEVRHSGGSELLDAQNPDSTTGNVMRWNVALWVLGDIGETYTVSFS